MARAPKAPAKTGNEDVAVLDKPAEEPVVEIVKAEPEKQSEPVDDGIARLKAQLEAEKEARKADQQARAQAEQRALESARATHQAQNAETVAQYNNIVASVEVCKSNADIYEQSYAQALANQDHVGAAKVLRAMVANDNRLSVLENGKQAMEEAAKRAPPFRPPQQTDPVEKVAATLTPKSAIWLRHHPEYARTGEMDSRVARAHYAALADGVVPDTDEYFAHVEDTLKIGNRAARILAEDDDGDAGEPLTSASQGRVRQSSPPAAPVSRSMSPSGVNNNPRVIRLTADQAEMARMSKMTEREYWDQLQRARGNNEITH